MNIYLAAPYTHWNDSTIALRVYKTTAAAAQIAKTGHLVIAPTIQGHWISKHRHMPHSYWMDVAISILASWADRLVVLTIDGHDESKGVQMEEGYWLTFVDGAVIYWDGEDINDLLKNL